MNSKKERAIIDYPKIKAVKYLRSYDILVSFDNGESRLLDMSDSFSIPAAQRYAPLSEFKKIGFNDHSIWWGDRETPEAMIISATTAYRLSYSEIVFIAEAQAKKPLKDLSFDKPTKFYAQNKLDCEVLLPEALKSYSILKLNRTYIWYDKHKKIFTVQVIDSYPSFRFNINLDGFITACNFFWDNYNVPIRPSELSKFQAKELASLVKETPHVKYQILLDKGVLDCATKKHLESLIKDATIQPNIDFIEVIPMEENPNIDFLPSGETIDLTGARLATEEIEAGADTMTKEEMYEWYCRHCNGIPLSFEKFCGDK